MHARIDVLTRPHFWSLLPSAIFDWVVIILSVFPSVDALKHADTSCECYLEYFARHPHRTDPLLVGACEHCSSCTSLHLQKRITTGVTHHPPAWHTSQFWHPWVSPNRSRTARSVESIPPWLKSKSASVWSDKKRRDTCFRIRRVSRLDRENAYMATRG